MLVNNAGVYKFLSLEETTEDEFHREFNINVLGTILATKEAIKRFGPNGGSIVNMSSIASADGISLFRCRSLKVEGVHVHLPSPTSNSCGRIKSGNGRAFPMH